MGGTCAFREEPGKHRPRSCRAQENGPKQCPRQCATEKGVFTEISENRGERWTRTNERRNSFVAQRHKGIHPHAPASGQIARRDGNRQK